MEETRAFNLPLRLAALLTFRSVIMASVGPFNQVHYPESDGKPMGETDEHRDAMVRHIQILQELYRDQRVYVSGDLLVYYQEGDPRKYIVPDAFVVKGVSPNRRRTYKIWLEGKAPDVVIETTSRKTRRKDTTTKPELYARLGVAEYFIFDPDGEYLDPPLQGYRLRASGQQAGKLSRTYVRLKPDQTGSLTSRELGLRLRLEEGQVRFYRLDTGEPLLAPDEARRAAEAEVARLRAELRRRSRS
jgi:Uma2 family endonuclease